MFTIEGIKIRKETKEVSKKRVNTHKITKRYTNIYIHMQGCIGFPPLPWGNLIKLFGQKIKWERREGKKGREEGRKGREWKEKGKGRVGK